ncbi:MAG TPA: Do family serine endopeptidase, partial [Propylenella sp.]|nr:Do family serine endopeptidase [Propylenella sp.]
APGSPLGEPPARSEPLPPPILPAPDVPIDDPVVELPPEGSPPPVAAQPGAIPGLLTNSGGAPFSFADLAEQLLDSVVYISTSQRVSIERNDPVPDVPTPPDEEFFEDFFDDNPGGGSPRSVQSLGSGFVIDPSGLIVTNNHVITDADEIVANFANGSKLTAEVVGVDDKTDLALLKVTPQSPLQAARFGRSEALRVGDWVIAIGNPFGFGGTVTAGIVSALDRNINSGPYDHYIQTDASINRGNSGGPLFNLGGEVVGINTAIMSPTGGSIGIGFAVPSEIAVPVIEQLREFGEVRRGWIGVRIQDVTEDAVTAVGMRGPKGALIAGLTGGGPAEKGGIKAGDIVVEFGGKPVENMRALPQLVADTPPGEVIDVTVLRDGKEVKLKVEVGLLDEEQIAAANTDEPKEADQDKSALPATGNLFGLTLGTITEEARQTYAIDAGIKGVLVTEVAEGSEAAEKNVQAGDVIVQVSQRPVSEPEDVTARVEQLKSEGRRTVMFLVSGAENKLRFVSLRIEEQ